MRRLLCLTLSFAVCLPGLFALGAAPARAQQVASAGNLDTLRRQYEQMLAVERNAATPPEVRELNRTFLEERRAQLAAAIRKRIGALDKYRAAVAGTLNDAEQRYIDDSIARLSAELQALLPEAVPTTGTAARRTRRPARSAAAPPAVVAEATFDAPAPGGTEPAASEAAAHEPAAPTTTKAAAPIEIVSPERDRVVHTSEVELEVNVGDEAIDDLMVAVYTPASEKPKTARVIELKRSDKGTKSVVVALTKGENRVEVSDLKRGEVLAARKLTYAPASDVLNAPARAEGDDAAPPNVSLLTKKLKKAKTDDTVVCGQLQLASLNETLALIRSTPALGDLAARFRSPDDPRRGYDDQSKRGGPDYLGMSQINDLCEADGAPRDGLQRSAAVDLLNAVLIRLDADLMPKDTPINNTALADETAYTLEQTTTSATIAAEASRINNSAASRRNPAPPAPQLDGGSLPTQNLKLTRSSAFQSLSADTIRKQIVFLQKYLNNIEVTLTNGDKTFRTYTDRDGNFAFVLAKDSFDATKEFTLSTEGDANYTTRKVAVGQGDRVRVNLDIEDRPVSLLTRAIVGYDQSGAAAAKSEQSYFFDFFVSKTFPFRQKVNPDFGEPFRIWGDFRINSVPQSGDVTVGDFAGGGFTTGVSGLKVKDVARVFEVLGGIEYRLTGNNKLRPSFDRQTKQKFSLSFIGSYGIVTPLDPLEKAPTVFKVFEGAEGLPPAAKGKEFVAFVPVDRDRFFRQYYAGLRVQTFFFNKYEMPLQRFPAQFDVSIGQNAFVTGGRLHGPVLRMEGFFPLPYEKAKFINLFATAQMIPGRANIGTPLVLQPAPADTVVPAPNVALVSVPQPNRDHYRIGIGIDFIPFLQKLLQPKTSGGSAGSAGGSPPAAANNGGGGGTPPPDH